MAYIIDDRSVADFFSRSSRRSSASSRQPSVRSLTDLRLLRVLFDALKSQRWSKRAESKAAAVYSQSLLWKGIEGWRQIIERRQKAEFAIETVQKKRLEQCFFRWQEGARLSRREEAALEQRRLQRLERVFGAWLEWTQAKVGSEDRERRADGLRRRSLLAVAFKEWRRESLGRRLTERCLVVSAQRRVFQVLKIHALEKRRSFEEVRSRQLLLALFKAFSLWKLKASKNSYARNSLKLAVKHRHYVLINKSFASMNKFLQIRQKSQVLQLRVIKNSVSKAYFQMKDLHKEASAMRSINRVRQQKTFLAWKIKTSSDREKGEQVQKSTNKRLFSNFLTIWKDAQNQRRDEDAAVGFWARTSLLRCLRAWYSIEPSDLLAADHRVPIGFSPRGTMVSPRITHFQNVPRQTSRQDQQLILRIFDEFKKYYTRKKKAEKMKAALDRRSLMNVFSFWKEFSRIKNLVTFKINYISHEAQRKTKSKVFEAMVSVLKREREMFSSWIPQRLLKLCFRGLTQEAKRYKALKRKLKAIILRKAFKLKQLSIEAWSSKSEVQATEAELGKIAIFIEGRIALLRLIARVAELKTERTIGTCRSMLAYSSLQRAFREWAKQRPKARGDLLAAGFCLQRLVKQAQIAKQERAADYYANCILLKKAFTTLSVNIAWQGRRKMGVQLLVGLFIARRLREFFEGLAEQAGDESSDMIQLE